MTPEWFGVFDTDTAKVDMGQLYIRSNCDHVKLAL